MNEHLDAAIDFDDAPPRASAMIESLRAFGYDLPTAVADLIDNSVSASAKRIQVHVAWNGANSNIAVVDDGSGMSEDELFNAMRPGSKSPLDSRAADDLGRFGLGLKTASFSQCRSLTVASMKRGAGISVRRWDLDYVQMCGEWRLQKGLGLLDPIWQDRLRGNGHGTVVIWEKMDRIVGNSSVDDEHMHRHFLDQASHVKQHLGMVFQRFLRGAGAVEIKINESEIGPWDPFLEKELATEALSVEVLPCSGSEVSVQPFVLPHFSKLSSEAHADAAGPRGWNAHQGFYVYRNHRLLVSGDWLGLGFKNEEHYKLARIRLDIPNSIDSAWALDVKKSRATPPAELRRDLRRIAKVVRERASRVYRHRGKVIQRKHAADYVFPWKKIAKSGKISYRVNREHPLVQRILSDAGDRRSSVVAMLSLLEQTVPVPLIVMTNAEKPDAQSAPYEGASSAEVQKILVEVYSALKTQGMDHEHAVTRLAAMEPFDRFPELVAVLSEESA